MKSINQSIREKLCIFVVILLYSFFNLMVANQIYNIEGKVRGIRKCRRKRKKKRKRKQPNRLLFNFFAHGIAIAIIIS